MNAAQPTDEDRVGRALILAATVLPPLAVFACIVAFAVNVPSWDDWRWADMVLKFDSGQLTFADLWHQNNEHRILLPSLIALGLARLGGYNTIRENFFSLACGLASLACLYTLLRRTVSPRFVPALLLVESLLLFSLGSLENYLWGFQLAWILAGLLSLATVVALSDAALTPRGFVLGLVAALAASISSAQGLSTLPVGFLLLTVRRPLPRAYLVVWAIESLAMLVCYFSGLRYDAPQYAIGHEAPNQLVRVPFVLAFIGSPLAGWSGTAGSVALGALAALLSLAAFVRFGGLVREGSPEVARWAPWIATSVFGWLGGAMVALGRGGLGLEFARAERYVSLATMTWLGLVPLAALALGEIREPAARRRANAAALVLVALLAIPFAVEEYGGLAFAANKHDALAANYALVRNYRLTDDATLIGSLFPFPVFLSVMRANDFPNPDNVRALIAGLEEHHEGPFIGD